MMTDANTLVASHISPSHDECEYLFVNKVEIKVTPDDQSKKKLELRRKQHLNNILSHIRIVCV